MLFALSLGALGGAGIRVASVAAPRGLERVIAAVTVAGAATVAEPLLLGAVGLGGSTAALCIAAAATWLAARALTPAPAVTPAADALERWRALTTIERALLGGAVGLFLAWTAWLVRTPALGIDSLVFHLPESLAWVHNGHPGSIEALFPGFPIGNYPLASEVMVGWGLAIARSFVPAALFAPAMFALLAAAGWVGLRALGVSRVVTGVAVAVLCAAPTLSVWQLYGAQTDLPAVAWLVAGGALAVRGRERPGLAPFALVAVGLAIGTKSTVLPLGLVLAAAILYEQRSRARALAAPLAAGTALALLVGGFWYLRNLFQHGSPLWPFVAAPWGDPVPKGFLSKPTNVPFLEDPRETLSRLHSQYATLWAGGIPVMLGGLLAWVLNRSRAVVLASAAAAVSLVLWTRSPLTGVAPDRAVDPIVVSSIRYLLPGLAAAVLALALASRRPGTARWVALGVLAVGLVWNLLRDHAFGFPEVPSAAVPAAGIAIGAAVSALAGRVGRLRRLPAYAAPVALVALGALMAPAASGFLERHARTGQLDAGLITWARSQRGFRDGNDPIAIDPAAISPLAGDRLRHPLHVIPVGERCPAIEARAARGWVVLRIDARTGPYPGRSCFAGRRPAFQDGFFRVFARADGRASAVSP